MNDIKIRPAMDKPKILNRDSVPKEAGSIWYSIRMTPMWGSSSVGMKAAISSSSIVPAAITRKQFISLLRLFC